MQQESIFGQGWKCGLPETVCGWGSTMEATVGIRQVLPVLVAGLNIRSIADVGAGDCNWIQHVDLGLARYMGYDLVPRLDSIRKLDILKEQPESADLAICRDVLIHFPNDAVLTALKNLRAAAKYLILTTYPGAPNLPRHQWTDDPHKCFAPLDLSAEPFSLGQPLLLIPEKGAGRFCGLWKGQLS